MEMAILLLLMIGGLVYLIATNKMQQKWSRIATFISLLILGFGSFSSYGNTLEFDREAISLWLICVGIIYFICWSIHWIASAGKDKK